LKSAASIQSLHIFFEIILYSMHRKFTRFIFFAHAEYGEINDVTIQFTIVLQFHVVKHNSVYVVNYIVITFLPYSACEKNWVNLRGIEYTFTSEIHTISVMNSWG